MYFARTVSGLARAAPPAPAARGPALAVDFEQELNANLAALFAGSGCRKRAMGCVNRVVTRDRYSSSACRVSNWNRLAPLPLTLPACLSSTTPPARSRAKSSTTDLAGPERRPTCTTSTGRSPTTGKARWSRLRRRRTARCSSISCRSISARSPASRPSSSSTRCRGRSTTRRRASSCCRAPTASCSSPTARRASSRRTSRASRISTRTSPSRASTRAPCRSCIQYNKQDLPRELILERAELSRRAQLSRRPGVPGRRAARARRVRDAARRSPSSCSSA